MANFLIVDDSQLCRDILRVSLETGGYTVIGEASNGAEAVDQYKELRPDITIMDITMPVMNGIEALKEIIDYDADAKVIMVSASAQNNKIAEAMIIGAIDFFAKPFDPELLLQGISSIV